MIALKDDDVWNNLGDSSLFDDGLDNPSPPFAFNSGMYWRQVPRDECIELGLIEGDEASDEPDGAQKTFGESLTIDGEKYDEDIVKAMREYAAGSGPARVAISLTK